MFPRVNSSLHCWCHTWGGRSKQTLLKGSNFKMLPKISFPKCELYNFSPQKKSVEFEAVDFVSVNSPAFYLLIFLWNININLLYFIKFSIVENKFMFNNLSVIFVACIVLIITEYLYYFLSFFYFLFIYFFCWNRLIFCIYTIMNNMNSF